MMFNFNYITPEQAVDILNNGDSVEYYRKLANNDKICENCSNPVWKLADTDLCFSCTTGETDASDDYELI